MAQRTVVVLSGVVLIGIGLLLVGCQQLTPEQKIESLRGQYKVELLSVAALGQQGPEAAEEAQGEADVDEGAASEAADSSTEDEDAAAMPKTTDVMLDILISTEAAEPLPGLTLDVSQGGPQGEKATYRIWVNTSKVTRGSGTQISHVLEGIDYEEGDGFHVEVRTPVPETERGDYAEFSQAGESS